MRKPSHISCTICRIKTVAQPSGVSYSNAPLQARMVEIPEGVATLGQAPGQFGWDNEFNTK